jgi:hypothetical protein
MTEDAMIDRAADFTGRVRSLEHHPLAEMFPLIEGDDFIALVDDIRAHGIRVPIMLYEGKVLDGRNRLRAGIEAGHRFTEKDFTQLAASVDPESFVLSANLQRRSLDNKGKRAIIAKLIESKPGLSDRAIARLAGVNHKTVGDVRDELAKRAQECVAMIDALSASQLAVVIAARGEKLRSALGL